MAIDTRQIFQDTLLETGRVNRPPLRRWAAELLQRLAGADKKLARAETAPAGWLDTAGSMNNASLIEVYRGDAARAHALCELQLRWAEEVVRRHGPIAGGEFALQPWVNLGRLALLAGDRARALRHFALLLDALEGRAVQLGPIAFDASTFGQLVERRALWGFLRSVYVFESAKVYATANDFVGAEHFLQKARTLLGDTPLLLLDEAELVALARLGRYGEAMAVTERAIWQQSPYDKLVRVTYRVALLSAKGSESATRGLAAQLAERVLASGWEAPGDQCILRYLQRLALLTQHLALDEFAGRLGRLGLKAARHLADVPLELFFLELLLERADTEGREALAAEREALLEGCLYATLLKPRGRTIDAVAAADPVFNRLRRKLESTALAAGLSAELSAQV